MQFGDSCRFQLAMAGISPMIPADWKDGERAAALQGYSGAQWAWEFLRRNPDYQQQWLAFIDTWKELEAAYGKAPNRDFCAWKNDPRAWVSTSVCSEGDCRIDQDKVLIECAMGARWGFYKFPPDPQQDDAVGRGLLTWRQPADDSEALLRLLEAKGIASGNRLDLSFDLSLPLAEQLQQAKRQLQLQRRIRIRQQGMQLQRVSTLRKTWTDYLRLLDGDIDAAPDDPRLLSAQQVMQAGYRQLPWIPD